MIKVFGAADTEFLSNGDKVINPIKAIICREDNGDYYLELETSFEYTDCLSQDKIVVVPTPWGDQAFRLNNPERTGARLIFNAKHVFFDAQNYILSDVAPTEKDGQGALDWILARTDVPGPFTGASDISDCFSTRFVRKSLLESIIELAEMYNGHIDPDNYRISMNSSIGQDRGITVSYGKNLTDIKAVEDWDGVVTKILPVGYNGTTLPELYLNAIPCYEKPYTKVIEFTPPEEIDKENPDAIIADLRIQATAFLEANQYPKVNYKISAHIEGIVGIGDIINVKNEKLGIDILTSVISVRYNCLSSRFEAIEFGNFKNSIKGLVNNIKTAIATVEKSQASQYTQLNSALAQSQTTIMEYLTVGHKYVTKNAIYFMDTADPATAQHFMILSLGGIGFGTNGIDGGYTTAWTLDGAFNADFITAGSINANRISISGGTLPERLTEIESSVPSVSITAPANPGLNQTWLNTSVVPNQFNCWNGTEWVIVTDLSSLNAYKNQIANQLATLEDNTLSNVADIMTLKEATTSFNVALGAIIASVSEALNGDSIITKINQSAQKIILSVIQQQNTITTSKGYIFDNAGLQIESDTSDFSILIDEDEVTFKKKSTGDIIAQFTISNARMKSAIVEGDFTAGNLVFQHVVVSGVRRTWVSFQ